MFALARIATAVFDVLVAPFGAHRLTALLVISLLGGTALALVFRVASNQSAIALSRQRFKARILELRLYPDDIVLIGRAFGGALAAQVSYLRYAAPGILVVAALAVPLFVQVEQRFAVDPLGAGARTLVTAALAQSDPRAAGATLSGANGVAVDPRPVRVRATREVVWAVDVQNAGRHNLELSVGDAVHRFTIEAAPSCGVIGRLRRAGSLVDAGTQLGLPRLETEAALAGLRIAYPTASYELFGARFGWLSVFLMGTLAGALLPARLLRIHL